MFPVQRATLLVFAAILALVPSRARATTITVPGDVATIQAALDAAPDTVHVLPGTYPEAPVITHAVVLMGSVADPPTLLGLAVHPPDDSTATVVGFHVVGLMRLGAPYSIGHAVFRSCAFDSMLGSDVSTIRSVSFDRCGLNDPGRLYAAVAMDSCVVQGELEGYGTIEWDITSNLFRGTGSQAGLHFSGARLYAAGNTFEGYGVGLSDAAFTRSVVRDNILRRCRLGLNLFAPNIEAVNNLIEDGTGDGIRAECGGRVDSNLVRRCRKGIFLIAGESLQLRGNRIGHCASDGIYGEVYVPITIRNNTLYSNGGAGLSLFLLRAVEVSHNIFFGNASPWLLSSDDTTLAFSCNDIFGNGVNPEFPGNISVDPGFCDVNSDDVHLMASSPLAGGACGLVGALGVGCDVATPVLAMSLSAERGAAGVLLRWDAPDAARFALQRSEATVGPWVTIVDHAVGGSTVDGLAAPDRDYWYRLASDGGTAQSFVGEAVHVEALSAARFDLWAMGANPVRGTLRARFSLPRSAAVSIDLLDLQGRRLATLARGEWSEGTHHIAWTNSALPPGNYVLVYSYPGGRRVIQYALLR